MGRTARKRHLCHEKARYSTWDAAECDGRAVHARKGGRANPATPYPCDICHGYHLANYVPPMKRWRERWVVSFSRGEGA